METGKWRAQHGEAQSMTEAADRAQAVLTEAVLRRKPCCQSARAGGGQGVAGGGGVWRGQG